MGMLKGKEPMEPNCGVKNVASVDFSNTTEGKGGGKTSERVGPGEKKMDVKVKK